MENTAGSSRAGSFFPPMIVATYRLRWICFGEWFVTKLLGISLDSYEQQMLQQLHKDLLDSAADQPQVVVHKDFHSRNLMLLEDDSLGVIDFQDAVVGPVTYDLVSLLKELLSAPFPPIRWKSGLWLTRNIWKPPGHSTRTADQEFLCSFDKMGLQRHIKVLGIFARLSLRDGKV